MAFNLPTPEGSETAALTSQGLLYRGEIIHYGEIEKFKANGDDELEIFFKEEKTINGEKVESLIFEIDDSSTHQLFHLQTFVETALMQGGIAVMGRSNPDDARTEGEVLKAVRMPDGSEAVPPVFDFKKIRKSAAKAFTFGA